MTDTLAPYDSTTMIAAGRAAAAAKPIAKRGAEILARLRSQLDALDAANANILRAEVPAEEAQKIARQLWSLRHETLAQVDDLGRALGAAMAVYTPLLDALLGDYWPTHPVTGEPLVPGIQPIAPPADENASQS